MSKYVKTICVLCACVIFLSGLSVLADEPAQDGLICQKLTLHLDFTQTSSLLPQTVRFNIFNAKDEFVYNSYAPITPGTKSVDIVFPIGPFRTGEKFYLRLTEGIKSFTYYDTTYTVGEPVELCTYAYRKENGEIGIGDTFHFSASPYTYADTLAGKAETLVNSRGITSKTNYLIWISKQDFKVTVLKKADGKWNYINSFACTIGAPATPTITGEFEYYMYQPKWYYEKYWCGPVMRFYNGYAIHSTLIKNDGTDYDARLGVRASLGCVRVQIDNMKWLADTIPLYTKVYITE